MLYPSDGEVTSSFQATLPPPPGLLRIIKFWSRYLGANFSRVLACKSELPPAVNGTITFIGLLG